MTLLRPSLALPFLLALLLGLAPPAAADEPGVVGQSYDALAHAALDAASCGWEAARGVLDGSGQSTTPVNFLENNYNVLVERPAETVLLGPAAGSVVSDADQVYGPGVDRMIVFADDSYTYSKCTVAHYTTWAARSYVWYQPTVDCYWVHSDCGLDNLDCNALLIDSAFDHFDWLAFGDPQPPAPAPCAPPVGVYCVCGPPPNPNPFPAVPTPEEVLG